MCTCNRNCSDSSIILPIGPPGINGTAGTNGTNGTNGSNGTNAINKIDTTLSAGSTTPYLTVQSNIFVPVADMIWDGTGLMGTPTTSQVIINASDGSMYQFRIVDITNATTLGTSAAVAGTTKQIVAASLSSVSSTAAIWQLQARFVTNQLTNPTLYLYAWNAR